MRAAHLRGTEFVGMAAGALLVLGLFLPWYETDASNSHSEIGGKAGSTKQHDVVSPGGVILPIALDGGSAWSLKDLYLPGRPPPDAVHAR